MLLDPSFVKECIDNGGWQAYNELWHTVLLVSHSSDVISACELPVCDNSYHINLFPSNAASGIAPVGLKLRSSTITSRL